MKIESTSFAHEAPIPERYAMGKPDPESHATFSDNVNPHLAWSNVPEGTKSFALVVVDPDAPSVPDDVNQEGRTIPADLPRVDFHHWALVDIPADVREIAEGTHSQGVTPGGKPADSAPVGRHGINDYTMWFQGDPEMGGDYYGYDGPFPPWNDSIVHHYHFILYALDVERLPVEGRFTGADVRKAAEGHVLAEARLTGTYAINPALRG